ncbi:hypothetical protein KIW84_031759 [Lathyrus oleraceus]|uniref:Uncharacterized protein n=1 Tax=Pisum sativum TaxID=3888 RepID=A0A9D5AXV2_PEA|nr:hypothetical protein KIW84_031759 [Pisum sativum]
MPTCGIHQKFWFCNSEALLNGFLSHSISTDGSKKQYVRLRIVPVIEPGNPNIVNFITQSAVVQGTKGCRGRDWFDSIAARPLSDLGLPFMSADKVTIFIQNFYGFPLLWMYTLQYNGYDMNFDLMMLLV